LAITLSAHVLFQVITPNPPYEGFTFKSLSLLEIIRLQLWHTLGAFSPLHWRLNEITTGENSWTVILKAFIVGVCLVTVLCRNWGNSRPKKPWLLLIYGLYWCFFITLPFDLSAKYQDWCLNGSCYYLDSRLAFPGICLIIVGTVYYLDKFCLLLTNKSIFRYVFVGLVMTLALLTHLSNLENQKIMYEKQKPFDQIKAYSCLYPNQGSNDKKLVDLLSKDKNILWYKGKMAKYKREYIYLYLKQSRKIDKNCNPLDRHLEANIITP